MKQKINIYHLSVNHTKRFRWRRMGLGIYLVLLFLLIIPVDNALSQPVSEEARSPLVAWDIQEVNAPPYFYNMSNRSLAYKNDGTACVVYGYEALYYSCYNTTTGIWSTEIVDGDYRVGEYAALAFNNQASPNATSYPFISYFDANNGRLKLAYNLGGGWIKYVVDAPSPSVLENSPQKERTFQDDVNDFLQPWLSQSFEGEAPNIDIISYGVGKYSSIDVDLNNRVHISYYDEIEGSLKYAYWDGVNWSYKVVHEYNDQGRTGLWTSIVVKDNISNKKFDVHISYRDEKYNILRYSKCNGSTDGDGCAGWIHEDVDANGDVGSFSSIALDSTGTPYISYYDVGNGNLKIAKRNGVNDWGKEKVDESGVVGWYVSMAISSNDKIHISYYKPSTGVLRYASKKTSGTDWEIKTLVEKSKTNLGLFTSIALGKDELPGVVYYNLTDGILSYISRKKSDGWNNPINIVTNSRDVGQATSLVINKYDVPYIAYLDATAGNLMMARWYGDPFGWINTKVLTEPHASLFSSIKLKDEYYPKIAFYDSDNQDLLYARVGTTGWVFDDVDTVHKVGKYVSLDLDSSGNPHISYYDATYQDLMYASWNNGWYTQTLDFQGDVGLYTSIILDGNDKPYISYYDADNHILKIAYKSAINAWVIETVDDGGVGDEPDVGQYSSIGLTGAGVPHISYYDATNGDLKYAYWGGAAWVISDIDTSVNDVGQFSSLAIDPTTKDRHICYLDLTDGDLKYSFWDDSSGGPWVSEIVDHQGDVGYYCSMALNTNGKPAISYYDNTLGNLMIALGYDLPPILPEFLYLPVILKNN